MNENYQSNFGEELLQLTNTTTRVMLQRFLIMLPGIVFLILGVVALIDPIAFYGSPRLAEEDGWMTYLFFGLGGVYSVLIPLLFKPYRQATIYEAGLVLEKKSKVTEIAFSDVKGIADYITRHNVNGIPVGKTRTFSITSTDGSVVGLGKFTFPHGFNHFAEELKNAHMAYLLKNLSKENIDQVQISFGDQLELQGGQLIYNQGKKKGAIEIALEDIYDIESQDGVLHLLSAPSGEKKKLLALKRKDTLASISLQKALNLDILYFILSLYIDGYQEYEESSEGC